MDEYIDQHIKELIDQLENIEWCAYVMRRSPRMVYASTELFVIHEGLKVQVIGTLGDWYNVRLADGNEGWIAKTDLEKI